MIGGAGGICSEIAYSFLANGDKIFAIDNRPGADDASGHRISGESHECRFKRAKDFEVQECDSCVSGRSP